MHAAPPGAPMTRYAYTAWDETPGSVALAPDAILEALTNDLLQRGDLDRALSDMQRRDQGAADAPGPDGLPAAPDGPERAEPLQLEALLQQAGLIRRTAEGLRLTPQGARQIGARALRDIFHLMRRGWQGQHTAMRHGRQGALTGETRAYEFGDAFDVHLGQTLCNALLR